MAAQLGNLLHAAIERAGILQNAIVMGANQKLCRGRAAGELLINIAFLIGDHRDLSRSALDKAGRCLRCIKPATALLLGERTFGALTLLAAAAAQKNPINKAEQRAILGVYRNHRMQAQTVLLAIVA